MSGSNSPPSPSSNASSSKSFIRKFPGLRRGSDSSSSESRKQLEGDLSSTLKQSGSLEDMMKLSREFGDVKRLESFDIKSKEEEQSHLAVSRSPHSFRSESSCRWRAK